MEKLTKQPYDRLDKPREACGVFGIVSSQKAIGKIIYYGLIALQHRGQESSGIVSFNDNSFNIHKGMGLVNQVFDDNIISNLLGNIGIGHTRYSTMGDSNLINAQPFIMNTKIGLLALAYNGNIINALELKESLISRNIEFVATSDSEVIAQLVALKIEEGYSLEDAINKALSSCHGAYSIIFATNDKLIATKDIYGIRPLCLGMTYDNSLIFASESCALDVVGARFIREINPGELLVIDKDRNLQSSNLKQTLLKQLCIFEIIYFSRPDSNISGNSVYKYRYLLGTELGRNEENQSDIVIPIPDSGIASAIGYSAITGIPYAQGLIKNRNIGRTFIQPDQHKRESDVKQKLNPILDIVSGKIVTIVDDSIVRGTTMKSIVKILRNAGAKKIHIRISSAPIKYPCFYGIDTDDKDQLIAARLDNKELCDFLNADTLRYLDYNTMLKCCNTGIKKQLCTGCFNGEYPCKDLLNYKVHKKLLESPVTR